MGLQNCDASIISNATGPVMGEVPDLTFVNGAIPDLTRVDHSIVVGRATDSARTHLYLRYVQ
jgi:hypothetical protein